MSQKQKLFVTCPKGVEDLLAEECSRQGLADINSTYGGVYCQGSLDSAYSLCLWSRVASRVLLQLRTYPVSDYSDLYQAVQLVDWHSHLDADGSFAIDTSTSHAEIKNSHFATLKIKDAIVDQFKQQFDQRPDVKRERPDIRVNAYIDKNSCTLYLDLSGEPLHKRGYRKQAGIAPLKENLAAAILLRANWPQLAKNKKPLIDPLCGSATLLLEAAYIASGMAPGLLRDYFGFINWKQHISETWDQLLDQAANSINRNSLPPLIGIEKSYRVATIAKENIKAAGFEDRIVIKQADSLSVVSDMIAENGLIVTNPPYGKRIGEIEELKGFYLNLGKDLKKTFPGWDVALFTASHELARYFGLRAHRKNTLYNGPLKCTLYQYHLREAGKHPPVESLNIESGSGEEAQMFANRLAKNIKHLSKWLRKEKISCYRVYDADIPQYAIAIDVYDGWVHVQEYEPPRSVNSVKAYIRLTESLDIISRVLHTEKNKIVLKTRKRQSGAGQYTRQDEAGETAVVTEYGLKFRINLRDYLDTGLFLDHRLTRKLISQISRGKSFLNLFAYTGTATVYAAAGGATSTTTVDMSNTYLAWSQQNLELNSLSGSQHEFIRDDCIKWLADKAREETRYQLIFLDPPTFSNSKRMDHTLDIKRDHVEVIRMAMSVLDESGILIFSSNAHGFKLDKEHLRDYTIRDITRMTTSEDYRRKPAHRCWCLARSASQLKNCNL